MNIFLATLPKSGTIFVQNSLKKSLDPEVFRLIVLAERFPVVDCTKVQGFCQSPRSISVEHIAATPYVLNLLAYAGITRVAVQVRDPRDALVSMWRHLNREDIKSNWSVLAHGVSTGMMPKNYYEISDQQRADVLTGYYFDWLQDWLASWKTAIQTDNRFSYHLMEYKDLARDSAAAVRGLLRFFGSDVVPVVPERFNEDGKPNVDQAHYRRGVPGSYLDELAPAQIDRINGKVRPDLFEYFGWDYPRSSFIGHTGKWFRRRFA